MAPAPVEKVRQLGDGVVGYLQAGQPGLTAAQFAALPASVDRLRAYLFAQAQRIKATSANRSRGGF